MDRREFFGGGLALAAAAQVAGATRPGRPADDGGAGGPNQTPSSRETGMIAVMAELLFDSKDHQPAARALARLAAATRLEPGCIRYVVAQDLAEPGRFHLSELWKDIGSLADHFATPHMAAFSSAARALGYSAPYLKQISVAGISDLKPAELTASRGAGAASPQR